MPQQCRLSIPEVDEGGRESHNGIVPAKRSNESRGGPPRDRGGKAVGRGERQSAGPAPDSEPDEWANNGRLTCQRGMPLSGLKNRVRQERRHGSVRGASGNRHPYRDGPGFRSDRSLQYRRWQCEPGRPTAGQTDRPRVRSRNAVSGDLEEMQLGSFRLRAIPARHRKFSTSIKSLPGCPSSCVYNSHR
jgi:hypothetical protein